MKHKILFVVNPISGGKDKKRIPGLVERFLDKKKFDYKVVFSERKGHAASLSKQAVEDGYEFVAAVGGDGTVNEVSQGLINSNTKLGVIPFGSGNGLARTLKIPLNPQKAIAVINQTKLDTIDAAKLNESFFFNMAGSGFDAHISMAFANLKSRGFLGYIKTTLREFSNYKPQTYHISIDGKELQRTAFMLSIANSSQFGNDAHIAPNADVKDGWLDVVIVKPFAWYKLPALALKMFNKTSHKSSYVEIFRGKNIKIERQYEAAIHLDGEPIMGNTELSIEILPLAITVIVP